MDNHAMWQDLGMDVKTHDLLCIPENRREGSREFLYSRTRRSGHCRRRHCNRFVQRLSVLGTRR